MQLTPLKDRKTLIQHLVKINIISLVLAFLAFLLLDQRAAVFFNREDIMDYRQWARGITDAGLSQHYFIASLLLYAYLRFLGPHIKVWQRHPRVTEFMKSWALNFFVALISSGILVEILKMLIGRQRPHVSAPIFDPTVFHPFNLHWHWHSFPSGHSQTMFTAATMMTIAFPRAKWLWVFFAAVICFTRVVVHDHFVSDTIFGACVGYTGTMIGLYLMGKTRHGLTSYFAVKNSHKA